MSPRAMLPLIDLVFLTLGAIVALMTQMQEVTALPVDLSRVGTGAAVVRTDPISVVSVDRHGALAFDGVPVTIDELALIAGGANVVLRADRTLSTESLLQVMAELYRVGAEVSVEVDDDPPAGP